MWFLRVYYYYRIVCGGALEVQGEIDKTYQKKIDINIWTATKSDRAFFPVVEEKQIFTLLAALIEACQLSYYLSLIILTVMCDLYLTF